MTSSRPALRTLSRCFLTWLTFLVLAWSWLVDLVFGCRGWRDLRTKSGSSGAVVAYVRTVTTASGATAVQIVWSSRRGSRSIEHIGSAHDEAELAALKVAAAQRLAAGQAELDLGLVGVAGSGPLAITSSQMSHLRDALCTAYQALGFESVT